MSDTEIVHPSGSNVIQFASRQRAKAPHGVIRDRADSLEELEPAIKASARCDLAEAGKPQSPVGHNERLRARRGEAWRKAEIATRYWRMMMDFYLAVSLAQDHGLPEALALHQPIKVGDRDFAVTKFREALVAQLLTPAARVADVNWKRAEFGRREWQFTAVKAQRIEKAIADDVAFLQAHPARQPCRKARSEGQP
jgi:hypothetical protein